MSNPNPATRTDDISDSKKQPSFGIMISCFSGDLPMLRGCLASVRLMLPRLPICLVTHGTFDVSEFVAVYGVSILSETDVDPRLRALSYGYGLTKMVSLWHAPFETFMHLDSDAVCWGDFLTGFDHSAYDFVFNEPHEVITDAIQRTQYFNPDKIDPGFDWRGCKFFNSGIFIARRGIFDLDEYLELLEHQRDHPGSLFGDQGPLNILVFRYAAQGKIKIVDRPLQVVVSTVPVEDLLETYRFERGIPALSSNTPKRLLHWAGKKPDLVTRHPFAEPMTYFRLKHLELARSARRLLGRFGLLAEDIHYRVLSRHRGSYIKAARSKLHWLADGEGRS